MRAFTCPVCHQLIFFENSTCLSCGARLGFVAGRREMVAVNDDGQTIVETGTRTRYFPCRNQDRAACNWLLDADDPRLGGDGLCRSCALTRTRPSDHDLEGMTAFAKAEAAKRRLVFQLDELGLPIVSRHDDPERGLAFDLLSSRAAPVTTGHDSGLITLDLAESDDAYRERTRQYLGEPYRTLLGHFRHEVGHYYWMLLVEGSPDDLERYRTLFGDEREDYGEAISRHYAGGPPDDWARRFVSAYATMHPWEDWAETFAHTLHIRDSLQTAASFGLLVAGPLNERTGRRDPALASIPLPDEGDAESFETVVAGWLPLTYALNAVNRSMGRDDLYPFVLAPTVIEKLAFVHARIQEATGHAALPPRIGSYGDSPVIGA